MRPLGLCCGRWRGATFRSQELRSCRRLRSGSGWRWGCDALVRQSRVREYWMPSVSVASLRCMGLDLVGQKCAAIIWLEMSAEQSRSGLQHADTRNGCGVRRYGSEKFASERRVSLYASLGAYYLSVQCGDTLASSILSRPNASGEHHFCVGWMRMVDHVLYLAVTFEALPAVADRARRQ